MLDLLASVPFVSFFFDSLLVFSSFLMVTIRSISCEELSRAFLALCVIFFEDFEDDLLELLGAPLKRLKRPSMLPLLPFFATPDSALPTLDS